MQFFIIVLLVCFFVFLFTLYFFSHDDFVFIRKNIGMEAIFNAAFTIGVLSLLFARTVYVISFPKPVFFSFLGFILFPYFPGLSLIGAVFGGIVCLVLYCWYKKFPLGRICDFFSLSLLSALPVGFAGTYLLGIKNIYIVSSIIFYLLFLVIGLKIFLRLSAKGKLKDGSISLLFIIIFSFFSVILNVTQSHFKIGITIENSVLFMGLIISISLFIFRELIWKANV